MQQTVLGERYTLIELLGGGDAAEVYLAHDEVLDRDVALKVLKDRYANDEEFVERFRNEAQSAARLSHPNIVSIYDQGRSEGGVYYIAMEYVPQGTLKERIDRDGALDPEIAAGVALQIADALSVAHKQHMIHGDVKLQNVLVTRTGDLKGTSDVKVTDFGIARAASASPVAAPITILDAAGYMSPEQVKGKKVSPASDLYSLGVVLYEMLTGSLPYTAEDPVTLTTKHVNEPPRSPREEKPDVPEPLDAITLKLLAKSPEDRYVSAQELAEALEQVRSGPVPSVVPAGTPEERRGGAFSPATAASALLCTLVLLGGLWALDRGDPGGEPSGGGAQPSAQRATPEMPASQKQQPEWQKLKNQIRDELDGKQPVEGVRREGLAGKDILQGTDKQDVLWGSAGDDELSGYDGDDKIDGDIGNDTLYGGPGSDVLLPGEGDDTIDDGDDGVEDDIRCGGGFDAVTVEAEDYVNGCESVTIRQR